MLPLPSPEIPVKNDSTLVDILEVQDEHGESPTFAVRVNRFIALLLSLFHVLPICITLSILSLSVVELYWSDLGTLK